MTLSVHEMIAFIMLIVSLVGVYWHTRIEINRLTDTKMNKNAFNDKMEDLRNSIHAIDNKLSSLHTKVESLETMVANRMFQVRRD